MEFAILVEREPAIEGSYGCSIPVYFFILKIFFKKFKIIFLFKINIF
jgi:aromatic ring-opening dioxygenase LigB subunit